MMSHLRLLYIGTGLLLLSSCSGMLGVGSSHQQKKPWLSPHYRSVQYPDQRYFMVYQEMPCQRKKYHEESIRDLGFRLRDELSRKIILQVVSESESRQSQVSGSDGVRLSSFSRFSSAQKSLTKLTELSEEFYYDAKHRQTCGIAYVEKKRLADSYYALLISALEDLRTKTQAFNSASFGDKIDMESSTRYRQLVDALRAIDTDKAVYMQLASDVRSADNRKDVQVRYNEINEQLQLRAGDFTTPFINQLLIDAGKAKTAKEYRSALQKYDEALVYNPSLESASAGRRECAAILLEAAKKDLEAYKVSQNYPGVFKAVADIIEIDPASYEEYQVVLEQYKQKFFDSTIEKIDFYLRTGDVGQVRYWVNILEPYAGLNREAYQKRVAELERLDVDIKLQEIQTRIYEKQYTEALNAIAAAQLDYPYNTKLADKSNSVAFQLYKERKQEFLLHRPTRMLVEGGIGLGSQYTRFIDNGNNAVGINDREYFFDHLLSVYQLGVYRKIKIKSKGEDIIGQRTRYRYSQVGLRAAYVNPSAGIYNLQSDSNPVVQPFSFELSAGWVGGRFLSVHLGMISESDSLNSFQPLKPSYFSGAVGIRIPISFVHLVTEAAFLSDFDNTYRMQLRSGILFSIGANKKYNARDRSNLKTEVARIKRK
ncbi:MAG: hypothetical protein ACK5CT_03350 [Bacteroidota bacterium]|jgi:hypothetical protein